MGVSLDGLRTTHDRFRGREGAFDEAVAGLCAARGAGVKTGVRFTVTRDNVDDLPGVLDLVEREGIPRFCLYHLVYSGRGSGLTDRDLDHQRRRDLLDFLIRKVLDWKDRGVATEILTVDNHADGVYIADYVRRHLPERIVEVERLQAMHGGCSAGTKFADIDAAGNVHPCQFWEHVTLGNVRERRFAEIWNDTSHPLMKGLKDKPSHLRGERCATCAHVSVCAGCRIRAETVTGDVWGDDPACYLTDEEIRRKSEIPSPKSQTSPKSE